MIPFNVRFVHISKIGNRNIFETLTSIPYETIRMPDFILEKLEKEIRVRFPNENSVWLVKHKHGERDYQVRIFINDETELAQFLLWTSDGIKIKCSQGEVDEFNTRR